MKTNGVGTLDDAYLEWLYGKVGAIRNRNPARSYWKLIKQLYATQFIWFIRNDNNRSADGLDLRIEFLEETDYDIDDPYHLWMDMECSMLEMLIALSRRLAFETDDSEVRWFWRLMQNLEIDRYTDELYEISIQEEVEEALYRVNNRTYSRDGVGGLFPLRNARRDQRKVELWYQMSSYLLEGDTVNNGPRN